MIRHSETARGLINWAHGEYDLVDYRRGNGVRCLGSALARLDLIELHRRRCLGEIDVQEAA